MKKFLEKLKNNMDLTFNESKSAFELLMTGKTSEDETYDFLTLLSKKGEVSDEIAGGVYVLRAKSKRVDINDCIDTRTWRKVELLLFHFSAPDPDHVPNNERQTLPHAYRFGLNLTSPFPVVSNKTLGSDDG